MTSSIDAPRAESAYLGHARDVVRETFERAFFERELRRLLDEAPGARLLDLGCGDGLAAELAGGRLDEYVGLDLHPPAGDERRTFVAHDLGEGLGPVGPEPFDVYFASFGLASHLAPWALERLCREIAEHARPGSLVALEALGLLSLEWPSLWDTAPGAERLLPYRLAGETEVHPWSPDELGSTFEAAGIGVTRTLDRSLQAGPKVDEGRYWPDLPPVRGALNALLTGRREGIDALEASLPPLPAHRAARIHHELVERRRALLRGAADRSPKELADAVWALEPQTGAGFGHGILVVGRVR